MNYFLPCFFFICFITLAVISFVLFKKIESLEKKLLDFAENKMKNVNKIILEDGYIDKVNQLIDDFIKQASEVYQIMKLSQNTNEYLKPEDAEIMKRYIYGTIKKNMTEDVTTAIKSIYLINSDEDLDKILDLRINLYMINFKN